MATLYSSLKTLEWKDNKLVMIDQTKLPNELIFVEFTDYNEVANAIRTLVVRGAPAIGISGAFGMALAALQSKATTKEELIEDLEKARKILFETRPTAVNLKWGLDMIMKVVNEGNEVSEIKESVVQTAKKMAEDDVQINMTMGKYGSELFNDNDTIMTHCNAGALATVAYGTALGVIRATRDSGKNIKVIATETRPVQQGSRLTAFELQSNPEDVVIEQRNGSEVTGIGDKKTAPDGINVINPAFDMTPTELISGIITEKGIAKAPFGESIKKLFEAN